MIIGRKAQAFRFKSLGHRVFIPFFVQALCKCKYDGESNPLDHRVTCMRESKALHYIDVGRVRILTFKLFSHDI